MTGPLRAPRTATIVYNPLAGPANSEQGLREVAAFWGARGWTVAVARTERPGHARELATAAAREGREIVFAAGGDGTISEVADGLVGSDTILAPLPAGTGNSLAKEWCMPRSGPLGPFRLLEGARALYEGRVQRVDVGRCNGGRHWLQWAGLGVDSYLVEQMEPRPKLLKRLGPAGYVGQALLTVPNYPPVHFRITVDGRRYDGQFLMATVTNTRRYGGGELLLSPRAHMDDGLFECWLVRGQGLTDVLTLVAQIVRGQHLENPDVILVRGRSVRIETEPPIAFHLDGDPVGRSPVECHLVPGALRVLAPATAPAELFRLPGRLLT